jgi:two-component system, chemotaxis family, sensor kinase CheA
MFMSFKRQDRTKPAVAAPSNRLGEAILKGVAQGFFLLNAKDKLQPQVSKSLATLFRRQDFTNLSFEKLIGPVVSARTLSTARAYMTRLMDAALRPDSEEVHPLQDVEVRLPNPDGSFETAHYSFDFNLLDPAEEPRLWLVRVCDITARAQEKRELEDLRAQIHTQGEILRSVLQSGSAEFAGFLQRTEESMKAIDSVLKKPARETDAFRSKLEETLEEVDRVRRDAAALKFTGLEAAARQFEDSLHDLRARDALSGSDFLPLAVKLDQLYGQFALIRQVISQTAPAQSPDTAAPDSRMTDNGTQIIEAPKFLAEIAQKPAMPVAYRMAQAGSLDSTLASLTELVAQEQHKTVTLDCTGMQLVPPRYQATVKNVSIQLIRNAVMHGIESSAQRASVGKPAHGSLHLEFKALADDSFELHFQDDGCGLDPEKVRATAVSRGVINAEDASRLRDRQAIKLIFKSGYTTLEAAPGAASHGTGMSLVRRYVNEAGGKIALASLLGHETRFKVTLPPVALAESAVATSQVA